MNRPDRPTVVQLFRSKFPVFTDDEFSGLRFPTTRRLDREADATFLRAVQRTVSIS